MDRYAPFGSQSGISLPPERPNDDDDMGTDGAPETHTEESPETVPDKPSAAEAKQARMDYMRNIAPLRRAGPLWPRLVAGAVIILLLIGVGVWLGTHHSNKPTPKKAASA